MGLPVGSPVELAGSPVGIEVTQKLAAVRAEVARNLDRAGLNTCAALCSAFSQPLP